MGDITRSSWTDDDGSGATGTILNQVELTAIYDAIEGDTRSANHSTVSLKSITDNLMAGIPFFFGGTTIVGGPESTSYTAGTTWAALHPSTGILQVDSVLMAEGTYRIQGVVGSKDGVATATIALVNLTDAEDTAMVTATGTLGARAQSGAITWPASGSDKEYAIKSKSSDAAVAPYASGIWLRRAT